MGLRGALSAEAVINNVGAFKVLKRLVRIYLRSRFTAERKRCSRRPAIQWVQEC